MSARSETSMKLQRIDPPTKPPVQTSNLAHPLPCFAVCQPPSWARTATQSLARPQALGHACTTSMPLAAKASHDAQARPLLRRADPPDRYWVVVPAWRPEWVIQLTTSAEEAEDAELDHTSLRNLYDLDDRRSVRRNVSVPRRRTKMGDLG